MGRAIFRFAERPLSTDADVMLGSCLEAERDFSLRFEYRGLFGSEGDSNHGFFAQWGKSF
jgi:hypothetical protein